MIIGFDARLMSVPGGLGRYSAELLQEMIKQNPNDFFVIIVKKIPKIFSNSKNIRWIETDIHWYGLEEQIKLGQIMNSQKDVQLWHIPHWNVPVTLKTPFVMTFHDFIFEEFPTHQNSLIKVVKYKIKWFFWRILLSINFRRARKIITISNYVREQIIHRAPFTSKKVTVIYNGLTHLPKATNPNFHVSKPYFLMVGNAYPHKNHAIILSLLKKYHQQISEHFYLITHRDRFSEALEKTVARAQLSDRIHIVFDAPDTVLSWMYENCEALIFPSLSEGFGIPPLEAFSYKKTVIAAKTSSLPEILGNNVYWFDPASKDDLFTGILNSKKDSESKKDLRFACAQKYSWASSAKSTRNLYQGVL